MPKRGRSAEANLEELIGLSFDGLPGRSAVQQFFDRYMGCRCDKTNVDSFHYSHECNEYGVVATLVTPGLKDRKFEGQRCENKKKAEQSAAEAFMQDAEVLELAARLPPGLSTLQKMSERYHSRRSQLKNQGLENSTSQSKSSKRCTRPCGSKAAAGRSGTRDAVTLVSPSSSSISIRLWVALAA